MEVAYFVTTHAGSRLEHCLDSIPPGSRVEVFENKDRDWPLAKTWNRGIETLLYREDYDAVVICNDDIILREDTGELLADALLRRQFEEPIEHPELAGKELLLVSAWNTRGEPGTPWSMEALRRLQAAEARWDYGPDYSCFCISRRYWDVVGPFDESFGLWFEDNDSHHRIRVAGFEAANFAPYFHWGAQSKTEADPARQERMRRIFEASQSHFIAKWGGMPVDRGDPVGLYRQPFDGRAPAGWTGRAIEPHPREIPSAISDNEANKLAELANGQTVLELGAHYGFSTIVLGRAARDLTSVDWHQGDAHAGSCSSLETYTENLRRHHLWGEVTVRVGRFEDVLPDLGHFDGIFLDGQHDRGSVESDLTLLLPHIKEGGWIAFHDYTDKNPLFGVKEVVDEFCELMMLELEVVDTLAVVRVP